MRWCIALFLAAAAAFPAAAAPVKAGAARKAITPAEPMWMAGYASRKEPAREKVHDLWVKALAVEDESGRRFVLLTSDLCGLPRSLTEAVAAEVHQRTGLPRARLMLTCSHTHCGPVISGNLSDMYDMPAEHQKKIGPYTDRLRGWMVETIVAALDDLKPARLSAATGKAAFAVNRRQPTEKGVINGYNPNGPVDHDVPVLKVESADGKLRAVVFGYACHNTTMQFYKWCGDYAGYAQADLEEKHPGAVALFWIGCGADANPLPRSKLELCQKYGRQLADAVEEVLKGRLTPVKGEWSGRYAEVAIPFDTLPGKEKLAADLLSKQHAVRKRAERLMKTLESGGKLDDHYRHYPVQVWRLGDEVLWIALGGEVVVDYAHRLKKELKGKRAVWVTGYANDVMAYIPSARVLKEGGYEADSSQIYYGMPAKWAPAIEEKIIGKARELAK
ncbi:MAG TPA: neutral/alkaline non-lysosomal ceramidase N-terminal domain-containing protein [Gemmataceae bacterium]|nr:neutral/alkaline non-lysosomal ceramidase N-terminal domain-containing protein [Gemmataceae bacterium]